MVSEITLIYIGKVKIYFLVSRYKISTTAW